jgi:hypothetical protein
MQDVITHFAHTNCCNFNLECVYNSQGRMCFSRRTKLNVFKWEIEPSKKLKFNVIFKNEKHIPTWNENLWEWKAHILKTPNFEIWISKLNNLIP